MKYYVIGGQYCYYCYGSRDSLHAAKILASKHEEYWDNWQGFHTPKIYDETQVMLGHLDNHQTYPRRNCLPVAEKVDGKWHVRDRRSPRREEKRDED